MAEGPSATLMEPPPQRAGVAVINLLAPIQHVIATGFAADGSHLATSPPTRRPTARLTLRLEDASRLHSVMLCKTVPGTTHLTVLRAEVWTLDPENASLALLRPSALVADQEWEDRAYGSPQDDEALVRWLMWSEVTDPTPITWWSGTRMILHPGETLSRAIVQSGTYEPGTTLMIKRLLPRGGVFLDAGANSGVFSVPASRWVGAGGLVIAVEPSPREVEKLSANLSLNAADNVRVIEEALGRAVQSRTLLMGNVSDAGLNTLGPSLAHGAVAAQAFDIPVTTLDLLCEQLDLVRLDVIKADIEGSELDLLLGGQKTIRRFRPAIIIEVETSALDAFGYDVGEIEAVLEDLDYRIFALNGDASPLLLDSLAGFDGGNILAVPVEHSEEHVRASATAQMEVTQNRLLKELAARSVYTQAWQDRSGEDDNAEVEDAPAATDAERERLKAEVQTLEDTLQTERSASNERIRLAEAASAARLAEQAELLDQTHHTAHQLESRVRQQRGALEDLERDLQALRGTSAANEAALVAGQAERDRLAAALVVANAERAAADNRQKQSTVEFQTMLARQEARAVAADARMATVIRSFNVRHAAALAELDATRHQAEESASQAQLAKQSELADAMGRGDRLEGDAALLRSSLLAATSTIRERGQELASLREWTEQLDRELHARELLLQKARADPFGFFLKQIGIYRLKRRIVGGFAAPNRDQ